MRKTVWAASLIAALRLGGQEPFQPDHAKANIDGLQGVMFVSALENGRGDWAPAIVDGCRVYLASSVALHEHRSFPCNEWFLPPADGSYLVWLATEDAVSSSQLLLRERAVPYRGFGSVVLHGLKPAGFVTSRAKVPTGHTLKYLHLDAPALGFSLRVAPADAGRRFLMPPGRVVAGIFNAQDDAVAYSRPLSVKAGETTTFAITPPGQGSDLLVVLRKPPGYRDGPPLDLVVRGSTSRAPDVLLEQRAHVVAVWYGVPDETVTFSATSSALELKRELKLRATTVSTLRADLNVREKKR